MEVHTRMKRPSRLGVLIPLVLLAGLAPALTACSRAAADADATATPAAAEQAAPTPTVDRTVERVVTADGLLVLPVPPQMLSFPVSGTVLEIAVTAGQAVAAGAVLARVDLLPFDMAVTDAKTALASAVDSLAAAEEGASSSELAASRAEIASAEAALARLESGTSQESARLEVERAKNSLWGVQAQRDSICGTVERGFADQASCDSAQANVQAAEQGVQIAQQQYVAARATIDEDLTAARARVTGARAALAKLVGGARAEQIAALQARVEQARLGLSTAEADRERAVLQAPFAGTVTAVHMAEGVRSAPGAPVVTLAKTEPLRFATSNLSERNVGEISEGARASVVLTAYPDRPLAARVHRIAAQASEAAGGAVVFTVYLDVTDEGLPLRAGLTGRVEIAVAGESPK